MAHRDDLDLAVEVDAPVGRVVSLVPSLTESIAATDRRLLVGVTDWCSHPADLDVARIGGTKNPDLAAIVGLRPDVVIANDEENRAVDLDALRAAGVAVWVTAPRTLAAAFWSLDRMLTHACGLGTPAWLDDARTAWSSAYDGSAPTRTALVPIWRRPWMAVGADTFAGDLLHLLGVGNVLAASAQRYPRVVLDDVMGGVDLVVLPDEPYPFGPDDGPEAFGGWEVPVALVSGRDLTWYGPSLLTARDRLESALAAARPAGSANQS